MTLARRHVPTGQFIQADMATLRLDAQFDGVICWDALFHIERSRHRSILEKIHRWLRPGRRLILTAGGADHDLPPFTAPMFGHSFFYDAHPRAQMIQLVRDTGFHIHLAALIDLPDAESKGKLGILAIKPA